MASDIKHRQVHLDRRLTVPLHRQVEAHLREQITSGRYAPGEMMPSVRELCQTFGGINHLTVRQAIRTLAVEGLVKTVHGRGIFVAKEASRTSRIALVLPNLGDELTLKITLGVQRVFEANKVKALIMDSQRDSDKQADSIQHLEDLPLDGAVIFPVPYGDIAEQIFKLKLDRFPVVLVDRELQDIKLPSITVDNYQGSYALTEHVISQGYQRIGWVGEADPLSSCARFEGFRDAMMAHRLICDLSLVRRFRLPSPTAPSADVVTGIVRELLGLTPPPQAIIFGNDFGALTALQELKRQGLRVPQDIAVAGFDDIVEASRSEPSLTTVRQPMEQIGEEAAKLLLRILEQKDLPVQRVVLPVRLVARESC